jgi:hypothetical protein
MTTMAKTRKALAASSVALLLALAAANVAYGYSDVISGLPSDEVPRIWLSWNAVFHQDTFITTDLIQEGGGSYYKTAPGGYITVGRVLDHSDGQNPGAADRIVFYGAANITEVSTGQGQNRHVLPVDTTLKLALGNLAVSKIELVSAGDTVVQGTSNAIDSVTAAALQVPASKFKDNGDGIIIYKTYFNFSVVEGADSFFDYNRDGQISNAALRQTDANRTISDRPFIAIYETPDGGLINLNTSPTFNADSDMSKTDNLWVGNPYAPVDADYVGGPRGDDNESPGGTREGDPNIWYTTAGTGDPLDTPLLIGELRGFSLYTVVNLYKNAYSNQFIISNGILDLEITDGRLYDWYFATTGLNPNQYAYSGLLSASMFFDLGRNALNRYEYLDDGTMILLQPLPEPGVGLLVLGSLGGLALRRRRRI